MKGKLFQKYLPRLLDVCFPRGKFTSTPSNTASNTGSDELASTVQRGCLTPGVQRKAPKAESRQPHQRGRLLGVQLPRNAERQASPPCQKTEARKTESN